MSQITYTNKTQTNSYDATKWNAQDANEVKSVVNTHNADTTNPHGVTKAQVGLPNVDNTADTDKPVSTAQLAALNLKESKELGQLTSHGFQVGEAVYKDSTGWHRSSNANNTITSRVDWIVVSVTDSNNFVVGKKGTKFTLSSPLTVDTDVFLGSSTPNYTTTEPTTVGQIYQVLFKTSSTTEAVVVLSEPFEITAAATGAAPADGSITNTLLATDVKVGSLASLTTNTKSSVVSAINELVSSINGISNTTTGSGADKDYISLPPLSTMGSFAASSSLSSRVDLSWTSVSGVVNYVIQRSITQTSGYSSINSPIAAATSFSDTSVTGGTTYYYRAKAVGDGGTTRDGQWVFASVTTPASGGGAATVEQQYALNFSNQFNSVDYTGWNRLNNTGGTLVSNGTGGFSNLIDYTGAATSAGLSMVSAGLGDVGSPDGGADPSSNSVWNAQSIAGFSWKLSNGTQFKITGLTASRTHKLYFWANSQTWESSTVTFTANGVTTGQVTTGGNTGDSTGDPLQDAALREIDVVSNSSGEILITSNLISGSYVPLTALFIQRMSS